MEKLLAFLIILASVLTLWVKDTETYVMDRGFRQLQYSVQHAVHDGALQVDENARAEGKVIFEPDKAEEMIRFSLQKNLGLNNQLRPISTILVEGEVVIEEIVYFDENWIDPETNMPIQYPYIWAYVDPVTNEAVARTIFGPSIALVLDVKVKGDDRRIKKIAIQEYKF